MLKKTILMLAVIFISACNKNPNLEPQGKDMFDAENKSMLGYKLYTKVEDINNIEKYTFLKKEDLDNIYKLKSEDPRQISLEINIRDNKVYGVKSMYEYYTFKECNEAALKLFEENKKKHRIEKRTDISGKGYHFDGLFKGVAFITACTDLVVKNKIIHSTAYIDVK